MKIIISANSYWNLYNFRLQLIKSLLEKNFLVIAIASKDVYKQKLINETGIKCYDIKLDSMGVNPFKDIILTMNYIKLFYKIMPDFVLSFTIKPNIYGNFAGGLLRVRLINNISGLGTIFIKRTIVSKVGIFLYKLSLRFSSHVFFQNSSDRNLFLKSKLVNNSLSSVIPGSGIDVEYFTFNRKINRADKFIFVGRVIGDKGIMEFLESAINILKKYPEKKFIIAGEFNTTNNTSIKKNHLEKYFSNPNIEFLGKVDNIYDYLKISDVFVLPSYREGLSRALLEASSMSLPLITTNVPGCKDILIENYNGFLCEPKSIGSLTTSIEKMINIDENDRIKFGNNARKLVKEKFSIETVISFYHRVINSIL